MRPLAPKVTEGIEKGHDLLGYPLRLAYARHLPLVYKGRLAGGRGLPPLRHGTGVSSIFACGDRYTSLTLGSIYGLRPFDIFLPAAKMRRVGAIACSPPYSIRRRRRPSGSEARRVPRKAEGGFIPPVSTNKSGPPQDLSCGELPQATPYLFTITSYLLLSFVLRPYLHTYFPGKRK